MTGEIIKIPSTVYDTVRLLSFGVVKSNSVEWVWCRETFQSNSEVANFVSFLFYAGYSGDDVQNVIKFIRQVELIVNLEKEHQLVFRQTNVPNVLHITLSKWWKYRLRRSLLTALLRCGYHYKKHDGEGFVEALRTQSYTTMTWFAVERFLAGYTAMSLKKSQGFNGWQNFFSNKPKLAEEVLVRLKRHKKALAEAEKANGNK